MNVKEYLSANRWPGKWLEKGSPVEYYFTIPVDVSIETLWEVVSDTSALNEASGLNLMKYEEEDGKLKGTITMAGKVHEFVEEPWQWDFGKELYFARIYSKGYMYYVRIHIFITSNENGEPDSVTYYYGWIPRNFIGRLALILKRKSYKRNLIKAFVKVIEEKRDKSSLHMEIDTYKGSHPQINKKYLINKSLLEGVKLKVKEDDVNGDIIDNLSYHIETASDSELYRIRPISLAESWKLSVDEIIPSLLYATRHSMVNMTWDTVCPHCLGMRKRVSHLWEVQKNDYCEVCSIEFEAGDIDAMEITFQPHPDIRKVDEVLYCSAEPSKKNHIKYQKDIPGGVTHIYDIPFTVGNYRYRVQGEKSYGYFRVEEGEAKKLFWDSSIDAADGVTGPGAQLVMRNRENFPKTFIIEEYSPDKKMFRPKDLFAFQEFRDLFSEEALNLDLSIDIGVQNILFVDIVGSTSLYERVGNTQAFSIVRDFFKISHYIALKYHGVVVKTLGDAVMLSFSKTENAVRAAFSFAANFRKQGDHDLQVRVSLNKGPCLAVNLNSSIDYFGQSVNVAAKLQSFTEGGEIAFTEAVSKDIEAKQYLESKGFTFKNNKTAVIEGAGRIHYWIIKTRKK